jgi:putative hemolysin
VCSVLTELGKPILMQLIILNEIYLSIGMPICGTSSIDDRSDTVTFFCIAVAFKLCFRLCHYDGQRKLEEMASCIAKL